MTIHVITPYSREKSLGKSYNESCRLIPTHDWICLMDYDTLLLTPDAISIMYEYVERFPEAGLLTAYTNRIHPTSPQLLDKKVNDCPDILWHMKKAEQMKELLYQGTELTGNVSGFLMLISKKTWMEFPFTETGGCLGVDTDYWKRLIAAGKKIIRMDGLYVFHNYRLLAGHKSKSHLL